jgi:hypothetical protein
MKMEDALLSVYRFIVVVDPTDDVAYSIGSRYVHKTKGLENIVTSLEKNAKRRRNAHKKHVEGPLCESVVKGVLCDFRDQCEKIHITSKGYATRRPWCPSPKEKISSSSDVKEIKLPTPEMGSTAWYHSQLQLDVVLPKFVFRPLISKQLPCSPFAAVRMTPDATPSVSSKVHCHSPVALHPTQNFVPTMFAPASSSHTQRFPYLMESPLKWGASYQFPYSTSHTTSSFTSFDGTTPKLPTSPICIHSDSSSSIHTFGCSPNSSPSQTSTESTSSNSSVQRSPSASVHRPPPVLALVIDTPNTTPATPTHPFVHSPYTSTPTQIFESAAFDPQRSRHNSFSACISSPLTATTCDSIHSILFDFFLFC